MNVNNQIMQHHVKQRRPICKLVTKSKRISIFVAIVAQFLLTMSLFTGFSKQIFMDQNNINIIKLTNNIHLHSINQSKIEIEHGCFYSSYNCSILPLKYRDCMLSLLEWNKDVDITASNTHCELPGNFTFSVINKLGIGTRAKTYSVKFNNANNQNMVLKLAKTGSSCRHLREEYEHLKNIQYIRNKTVNIGYLYNIKQLPYYQWIHPNIYMNKEEIEYIHICFIFIEKVSGIPFSDIQRNVSLIPFNNLLKFTVNCYDDIVSVLDALYSMNFIYQDLSLDNIFINDTEQKCYLIDFGGLFPLTQKNFIKGLDWHRKLYCQIGTCSPVLFYNLRTFIERTDAIHYLQDQYSNHSLEQHVDVMKTMIYDANKYRLASLFFKYFIVTFKPGGFRRIHKIKDGRSKNNDMVMRIAWKTRLEILDSLKYIYAKKLKMNPDFDNVLVKRLFEIFEIFENDKWYVNEKSNQNVTTLFVNVLK